MEQCQLLITSLKRFTEDGTCQTCGEEYESHIHMLFTCRVVKEIFDLLPSQVKYEEMD